MKKEKLTIEEQRTYDFCRKMGDSHELAMKGVEIARKRNAYKSDKNYRLAYES